MDESTLSKREKKRLILFKKFGSRCTLPKPWSEAETAAAGLRDAELLSKKRQRERMGLIKKFGVSAKIGDFPLTDAEKEKLKVQGELQDPNKRVINESVESDQPNPVSLNVIEPVTPKLQRGLSSYGSYPDVTEHGPYETSQDKIHSNA